MQTPAEKFLMDTIKRSLNQHCGLRSDAAMLIFKFAREKTRKDSLSGSIMDYLDYAVEQGAMDTIIDPEEDSLWEIFRKLELDDESLKFKEEAKTFKFKGIEKVIYA